MVKDQELKLKVSSKPILANASPENYFILVTGVPLKNLKEFASSLENMNEWVFNHHVNDMRNDFANWVKDVFHEEELASRISKSNNQKEIEHILLRHLVDNYV